MRPRLASILVLLVVFGALGSLPAAAADSHLVVAQEQNESEEQGGQEGQGQGGGTDSEDEGEGASDPEAESGADAGQTEEAEETTGPPWTYQMSRMIVGLLLLLGLGIAYLYFRLVVQRQRGRV
jgi:hypothetical protein